MQSMFDWAQMLQQGQNEFRTLLVKCLEMRTESAGFRVLTAPLLKIRVFCYISSYRWLTSYPRSKDEKRLYFKTLPFCELCYAYILYLSEQHVLTGFEFP